MLLTDTTLANLLSGLLEFVKELFNFSGGIDESTQNTLSVFWEGVREFLARIVNKEI